MISGYVDLVCCSPSEYHYKHLQGNCTDSFTVCDDMLACSSQLWYLYTKVAV